MIIHTCGNCRHSIFELTPTGKPKRNLSGRCAYPLPEIPASLPACVAPIKFTKLAIWPDRDDCVVWEQKQ